MSNSSLDDDTEVEKILDELFKIAGPACGKPIEEEAVKKWWFTHYRGNFYYAIHHKKKKYEYAKKQLADMAELLGKTARQIAGKNSTITPLHAALASFQVDCPAGVNREDWCN